MRAWTPEELDTIGDSEELRIAPEQSDGSRLAPTPIWVVRAGDGLYIRSWRGPSGRWFKTARATQRGHVSAGGIERDVAFASGEESMAAAVDDAYRRKYGRYPTYVEPMVAPAARETTLKLVPSEGS